jgi:hypothetical protein
MTAEPPGPPTAPPGPDPGSDTAPYPTPQGPLISGGPAPTTGWVPPVVVRQEVAPGLVFADTPSRFVA